ncbi:AraC family transcriptional regulator [Dethiosulfatarculus sandiegensis]|uniref:AraC family transcriptional regulator n=1 Tax=Dethiosulfatarculus sandiegensis TaxID=1429043 RepID=A0A0D2IXQ0_9BACT|nr:AraC family transcriptional regulator [Dethiosulfatarculus sandiegensis]
MTPRMRQLMMQVLYCPLNGIAAAYFVEAKIMELIACKLDELEASSGKKTTGVLLSLKKDDVDRLHFARDLLKSRMENPPELSELARMVGISRTKLINGFSYLFGTTPAACLRDMRLKRARQLLFQREKSLTEIASIVGYASLSHFSKVFRAYYGVPPSRYTG